MSKQRMGMLIALTIVCIAGACAVISSPDRQGAGQGEQATAPESMEQGASDLAAAVLSDPVIQDLSKLDYSDIRQSLSPGVPQNGGVPFRPQYDLTLRRDLYTPVEGDLLYGWLSPGGSVNDLSLTLALITQFVDAYDKMPLNGADLFRWMHFGDDDSAYEEFIRLPREKQLGLIGYAINPATGRTYESLTSEEWSPYGVCFKLLTTEEEIAAAYDFRGGPADGLDTMSIWEVTVFGANPGEVLATKPIQIVSDALVPPPM